jgi:hypothetical protein
VVLALRFNQPVRTADVVSHTALRFEPHALDTPVLSDDGRARLKTNDPQSIERFQAKVAAAMNAASSASSLKFSRASSWDTVRFNPSPDLVVLEVTDSVPPDSWAHVKLDPYLPHRRPLDSAQRKTGVERTNVLRQRRPLPTECAPDEWNPTASRPDRFDSI